MNRLELISAGAGSGKTTDLCATVVKAVEQGLDPARILATTFTTKAAAELKGRIQAELLKTNEPSTAFSHRNAERLELAAIGTVHSVAHQLLQRYAIELGMSPRLDVLQEDAGKRTINDLLSAVSLETWSSLTLIAHRLGISDVQQQILKLLAAKRGNRIDDQQFEAQMLASANRVCDLMAPDGTLSSPLAASDFYQLIDQAIADIEGLANDATKQTANARQKLRQLKSQQPPTGKTYIQAIGIAAAKKSGANDMLDDLRSFAGRVRRCPALHQDVQGFSEQLAREAIRLEHQYQEFKAERGLVDFTDLEVMLLSLLEREDFRDQLATDFDLVLIDEFQDTNPLQLAIFERLRSLTPRSRWVGDPKQAIYGFRDTDPQLVNSVWTHHASDAEDSTLGTNYRSRKGLVQIVGELFSPVLGEGAVQKPHRSSSPRGIERWILNTKNQGNDAMATACGVAQLRGESIPWGDIAILDRTHFGLKSLAAAFDQLRIPYLLESPGLLSTREGSLVLAGLRLVTDRRDSLAAATVMHLLGDPEADTPDWIIERLEAIKQQAKADEPGETRSSGIPWEGDARLVAIDQIDQRTLSPVLVVQQVIEALNLDELVHRWGESSRRCANLDSLLQHATEFEAAAVETGKAVTVASLILYLEQLAGEQLDVRHPPRGHDAVTLSTYHASKGLEWPVVILAGLDADRLPDLWRPQVLGGMPDPPIRSRDVACGLGLGRSGQRTAPTVDKRTAAALKTTRLHRLKDVSRSNDHRKRHCGCYMSVALAKEKLVFVHRTGKYHWLQQLPQIDSLLDISRDDGEHPIEGVDTTFVLRSLDADMTDEHSQPQSSAARWMTMQPIDSPSPVIRRYHSPSGQLGTDCDGDFEIRELGGTSYFPSGAKQSHYASIGDAVHTYFGAIPSFRELDDSKQEAIAERCLRGFSVTGVIANEALTATAKRFCEWVTDNYPDARWHTEVAVSGPRREGGQWNGTVDLLLELPDASQVIVDHKSAPIRREHCVAKARSYGAQLAAYQEVLVDAGYAVNECWIHFPLAGVMARRC